MKWIDQTKTFFDNEIFWLALINVIESDKQPWVERNTEKEKKYFQKQVSSAL